MTLVRCKLPAGLRPYVRAPVVCGGVALLPAHPRWPGLATDTLIYALVWLALLSARRTDRTGRWHGPTLLGG